MDWIIGNFNAVYLMVFAVGMAALSLGAAFLRRSAIKRFSENTAAQPKSSVIGTGWSSFLVNVLVLGFLTLALMDFRWGQSERSVQQKGLEVMFVLDVSRSMLAKDASPNRLARAKQQIRDMVDEMAGDRIGLVAFAGNASQIVPMTRHYPDFLDALELADGQSVLRGGSNLGEAIAEAGRGFMAKTNGHKTMVIFTDGEDHESDPVGVAKNLHSETGARIFTIGLGNFEKGAYVPEANEGTRLVEYDGQLVRSKPNGSILQAIADQTEAVYIPAGTKRINMSDFYYRFVSAVENETFETAKFRTYTPRFQWFAGTALVLLILDSLRGLFASTIPSHRPKSSAAILALTLAGLMGIDAAMAQSPDRDRSQSLMTGLSPAEKINAATNLVDQGQPDQAIEILESLDDVQAAKFLDERDYNLGVAYYRQGNFAAAENAFTGATRSKNSKLAAKSRYNLGNSLVQQAQNLVAESNEANEVDPNKNIELAKEKLTAAIDSYRGALRIDPQHQDTRANIEIAHRLYEQLIAKQPPQEDQQKEDQQKEDQQKEDQQKEDQQQDEQQQEDQQQDEQPSEQGESGSQEQDGQSQKNQPDNPDSNQEPSEQPSDAPPQDADNRGEANQDSRGGSETENSESPENTERGEGQPQPDLEGDLKSKDDKMASNPQSSSGPVPTTKQSMTLEEAEKMLQAVRDQKMERELIQKERMARLRERLKYEGKSTVEKDW